MTVNNSRSRTAGMNEGATDGAFRKVRPDTEVADRDGDAAMRERRANLHPFFNYGHVTTEKTGQYNPGRC